MSNSHNSGSFHSMLLCKPHLPCQMNSHTFLTSVLKFVKVYKHSTNQDVFLTNLVSLRQAKKGFG